MRLIRWCQHVVLAAVVVVVWLPSLAVGLSESTEAMTARLNVTASQDTPANRSGPSSY
jgi:hypothetical protein